jgi:hypothetical protein
VESVPVALVWNGERETDAARAAVAVARRLFLGDSGDQDGE